MTRNDADRYLAVLSALSEVSTDIHRLVALLATADDDDVAMHLLREAHGFTDVQAQAVLDAQFRLLTRGRRDALGHELRDLRDALAAPWDPPLVVQATGRTPSRVELVLAGDEHRVEGADLPDCLDRLVVLVRAQLARHSAAGSWSAQSCPTDRRASSSTRWARRSSSTTTSPATPEPVVAHVSPVRDYGAAARVGRAAPAAASGS